MEMCRACLSTGRGMVVMDKIFLQNYNILTNLNVTITEGVLYTCTECYEGANFCIAFRNKCIASDLTLKEILFPDQKEKHEAEEDIDEKVLTIKKDIKIEYEQEFLGDYSIEYQLFEAENDKINKVYVAGDHEKNEDDNRDCTAIAENDNIFIAEAADDAIIGKAEDDKVCFAKKKTPNKKTSTRKKIKEKMVDSELSCKICLKSFDDISGLRNHLDNHSIHTPCVICGEHFVNLTHLLGHRIEHLPEKQKCCHICSKKYLKAPCLEFHYMRIHELAEKDTPIQCKKCTKVFVSGKKLLRHVENAHSGIRFTCDLCGLGAKNKNQLRNHMVTHFEFKQYECDLCDYKSKFSGGVSAHKLRKHTLNRVYCRTCTRAFTSKYLLDEHKCKNAMGIICPVCGIILKNSSGSTLKNHLMSHEDVPRYKCDICQAKFKTRKCHQTHMDKHAGTPKYRCEYCQRCFYSASVLIKHRRTHTGEKPYVCSVCKRGFTGNHNLKVHMKVHGIMNLVTKKDSTKLSDASMKISK